MRFSDSEWISRDLEIRKESSDFEDTHYTESSAVVRMNDYAVASGYEGNEVMNILAYNICT